MVCTDLIIFPFANVSNSEFMSLFANCDSNMEQFDLNSVLSSKHLHSVNDDMTSLSSILINSSNLHNTVYITTEEINNLHFLPANLSVLQLNCRSIKKNFNSIKHFLLNFNNKPDIISLSETWLKPSDKINTFAIAGYTLISVPRLHKIGGGSGLYISNTLSYIQCTDLPEVLNDMCDYCAVEICNTSSTNL